MSTVPKENGTSLPLSIVLISISISLTSLGKTRAYIGES